MALAREAAPVRAQYWFVHLVRAALAVVPGLIITFIPDHSADVGLVIFGVWALAAGLVLGALALRTLAGTDRALFLVNGVVTAAAGLLALSFQGAGLAFFLYIVSVWAAVTGFVELYAGLRERSRSARDGVRSGVARDWISVGALTAVLAVVYLLLPPHAVVAVGLLGAYLVIIAVFLGIAGFSLKWEGQRATTPEPEEVA